MTKKKTFQEMIQEIFEEHQPKIIEHVVEEVIDDLVGIVIQQLQYNLKLDENGKIPSVDEIVKKVKEFLSNQIHEDKSAESIEK